MKQDSNSMKTIAVMTLVFLPPATVAVNIPFLHYELAVFLAK